MDTDKQLLERYARDASEAAFRELVQRHINLVYSAAVRETRGNASMAEDITQAVFTELAQRATKLLGHPALSGWLYTCVRRMTANVRRAEERRQRREREAFDMNQLLSSGPADNLWHQVWPVLDDVMHELDEEERTMMVLRFFEGRNFREVGGAFGLTENAARMRVDRSLEKLRGLLSKRGVTSTASALAVVLTAGAATVAPSALASTVAATAVGAAGVGASSTFALTRLLSVTKTQVVTSALLLGVAGLIVWPEVRSSRTMSGNAGQASRPATEASAAAGAEVLAQSDAATPQQKTVIGSSQMTLRVVDAETGEPLPKAKLYLAYFRQTGNTERVRLATDAHGKAGVDIFELPFRGLNMFITADGHVPKVTSWGYGREMPPAYTMKLERGITIGGVVVDEAGQPIAGAKIEFDGPGNDFTLQDNIQFGPDAVSHSDGEGRWSCNMIPKNLPISLLLTHPEHADTTAPVQRELLQAHKIVMNSGFTVSGVVRDTSGNAIPRAEVRDVRMNEEGEQFRTTDGAGAFEFKNTKAGEFILAVKANGYAPAVQTLHVTSALAGVQFELGPGHLLLGRVVDEDGNPVAGVQAETTSGRRRIIWSTKTDVDGRFQWDSAPLEPLLYSFRADGFEQAYALSLAADGNEHEVKLKRVRPNEDAFKIEGTVMDAATESPLDEFMVLVAEVSPDWPESFRFATDGNKGRFSLSRPTTVRRLSADDPESRNRWYPAVYRLQVKKEGYVPQLSTNIFASAGTQAFTFRLQTGSGPSGVVLLPSGEPAANATVLLCTAERGFTIDGQVRVDKDYSTPHTN
jgi:RNA polymerase sigma factor (sigma-70 family)